MNRDHHFVAEIVRHQVHPDQLQLAFPERKAGVSFLKHGASRYAARRLGQRYDPTGLDEIQADSGFAQRVARSYEHAHVLPNERVRKAYEALRDETHAQFEYLTKPRTEGGLGVSVEFHDTDPYANNHEMVQDVHHNRRLKVLKSASTGGAPHPLLDEDTNDKFRAVHDAFGHAAIGRSFSRHGEEAAVESHRQMYSPQALPALITETRGQNSTLNYGTNPGEFHEQKPVILPAWSMKERRPRPAGPSSNTKTS